MSRYEYSRVRGYMRLLGFLAALLWTGVQLRLLRPKTLRRRSEWRQQMCLIIARIIGLRITVTGDVPQSGMIVSNHLSYLDAVVLGSLLPAVFVAKAEVRAWPLIGALTAGGGTIYVNRESTRAAAEVNRKLATAMNEGLPTALFPEGTTTSATEPLPFHPALFEPAVSCKQPVWPAALRYTVNGSSEPVAQRVCYWGDMTLLPHMSGLMRLRDLRAHVHFAAEPVMAMSRNEAARDSRDQVVALLKADVMDAVVAPSPDAWSHPAASMARTWARVLR